MKWSAWAVGVALLPWAVGCSGQLPEPEVHAFTLAPEDGGNGGRGEVSGTGGAASPEGATAGQADDGSAPAVGGTGGSVMAQGSDGGHIAAMGGAGMVGLDGSSAGREPGAGGTMAAAGAGGSGSAGVASASSGTGGLAGAGGSGTSGVGGASSAAPACSGTTGSLLWSGHVAIRTTISGASDGYTSHSFDVRLPNGAAAGLGCGFLLGNSLKNGTTGAAYTEAAGLGVAQCLANDLPALGGHFEALLDDSSVMLFAVPPDAQGWQVAGICLRVARNDWTGTLGDIDDTWEIWGTP